MKVVTVFAVMGFLLSGMNISAQDVGIDSGDSVDVHGQKFFWCEKGVPIEIVREMLILMNTCLEQKIANEVFIEILGKLLDQIKLISIDMEEKTKLQKNIQYLINTLKTQSKSETRELKTMIKAVTQL